MLSDNDARRGPHPDPHKKPDDPRPGQLTMISVGLTNTKFPANTDDAHVGTVVVQVDGGDFIGQLEAKGAQGLKAEIRDGNELYVTKGEPPGDYFVELTATQEGAAGSPFSSSHRLIAQEGAPIDPPPIDPPTEPPVHVPGQPDIIEDGKTLQQLCDGGGQVSLPSGKFWGVARITKDTTVHGNNTHLTAEGLATPGGKGMFETNGAPLTLVNLKLSDVVVNDQNGAAARVEIPAPHLTIRDCEVFNCQNGILTSCDRINIENCYFHDNGAGDGQTHEIYVSTWSTAAPVVDITNSRFFCGTKSCHAVKVRAAQTTIRASHLKGNTSGTAYAGTVLDIPDGGEALVEDCTVESIPGTAITGIIGYAMESAKFGAKTLTLRNVKIVDGRGNGGSIDTRQSGSTLVLENCTYTGDRPPAINGWGSVQGQFTKA